MLYRLNDIDVIYQAIYQKEKKIREDLAYNTGLDTAQA